ncbi:unnamed protein product [Dovyalis caffra]|uniref:F-box domain-containing protein n=1 Tax=Dovyalis caffra TaxID=77055 RepID=A0AAV1QNX0_9ROSI|nr:unnamed protein product [Dovyalis caffra]
MSCYISNLSSHILQTIFSKLSISTLQRCRNVCKSWQHILADPSFALLHQGCANDDNLILCLETKIFGSYSERSLYWLEHQGEFSHFDLAKTGTISKLNFIVHFVNSCNGLLCLCLNPFGHVIDTILCVSNPITGEYVYLPQLGYDKYSDENMCGLGFCSSTNQFKAIRIFFTKEQEDSILHAEVYTFRADTILLDDKATPRGFETDTWRSIGVVHHYNDWNKYCWRSFNAFVNGCFHWIINNECDYDHTIVIYSFHFGSEQFRTVSLPPSVHSDGHQCADAGVFRDSLYFSCFNHFSRDEYITVWVMRDYGVVESWVKLLVIKRVMPRLEPKDFKVMKFFENGNILVSVGYKLWLYNPERKYHELVEATKDKSITVISLSARFASIKDIMAGGKITNFG